VLHEEAMPGGIQKKVNFLTRMVEYVTRRFRGRR
jgi:hypothetical protein